MRPARPTDYLSLSMPTSRGKPLRPAQEESGALRLRADLQVQLAQLCLSDR
jgi:hypothetical protein